MRSPGDFKAFGKLLVSDLMKLQTVYRKVGLEIRVERHADLDGFKVGMSRPGHPERWLDVLLPPPYQEFTYSVLEEAIDAIRLYAGDEVLLLPEVSG